MKNLTIFSIFFIFILLSSSISSSSSSSLFRTRFLAGKDPKGKKCDTDPSVCYTAGSGGPQCCNKQCVNVESDYMNCGKCGNMCKFTEVCCGGKCVNIAFDKRHCGRCFNKCQHGVLCLFGMCQYA
ncbi:stigma-specific STIG1-like protein 1 [Dioscorea cayenensis subsp. rotundata]|uniref:Stigma-specific STIG1-like protein 1 n=1 Tax=Dioscorea cayennensis subsp. rotundata TaxID=55577 RepID=A0AB40B8D1_DIOCR|nr:stigma-specific STIG1-like protein 1 [Dioscorea cayenensis subsp. rotundata]